MYTLLIIGLNLVSFGGQYETEALCKASGATVVQVELKKHFESNKNLNIEKFEGTGSNGFKMLSNGNIVYKESGETGKIFENVLEWKNISYVCNKNSLK